MRDGAAGPKVTSALARTALLLTGVNVAPRLPVLKSEPERQTELALVSATPDQRWASDWRRRLSRLALPESGSDRAVSLVLQDYRVFAAVPSVLRPDSGERFPEPEPYPVERSTTQSRNNLAFRPAGLGTIPPRLSPSPVAMPAPVIPPPLTDDESTVIPSLRDPSPLVSASKLVRDTCGINVLEPMTNETASFITTLASPSLLEVPTPFELASDPGYLRTPLAVRYRAIELEASSPVLGLAPHGHHPLRVIPDLIDTARTLTIARRFPSESVIPDIPGSTPRLAGAAQNQLSPVAIDGPGVADDRIASAARVIPFNRQLEVAFRLSSGQTAAPEAAAATWAIRPVPDSPAFVSFANHFCAGRSPDNVLGLLSALSPHETTFLTADMRPHFPAGTPLEGAPAFIQISTAKRSRATLASSTLRDIFDAPAIASFSAIALLVPSQPSLVSERQFVFNPLRSPCTRLRPIQLTGTPATAPTASLPVPLDFRWQRERSTWDRAARWKRSQNVWAFPKLALATAHPAAEF
jgi:hypothetical protein